MSDSGDCITVKGKTYSILKPIKKGGSSVVYAVYDHDKNLMAIKQVF